MGDPLDLNPDGIRVATGEIGKIPLIFVWDSNTLLPVCKFIGDLLLGVCALSFCTKGDKLCAISIK